MPMPTPNDAAAQPWPVMILAHNEERHIEACLDSLFLDPSNPEVEAYVMANGCTDRTEELVQAYALRHPGAKVVSIKLGDKCNAWNVFVHETVPQHCPGRPVYFFMDGDATAVPGSLRAMAAALQAEPHAHAASAPPVTGRNGPEDRRKLLELRDLVANLYALRGSFVERLQQQQVRLPLKLEGDDGLLGALIKWDLDPARDQWDNQRVVPCADAGFAFQSMSLAEPKAWRAYWKRSVRYGRRLYEFDLLGRRLRKLGLAGLPADITQIYADAHTLKLRRNGLYTLTNWIALRQMQRIGKGLPG